MVSTKFCPRCDSEDITLLAGGVTGTWMCKKCGFSGIFPEKEAIKEETEKQKRRKK